MRFAGRAMFALVLSSVSLATFNEAYAGFERRFLGPRSIGAAGALSAFGDGAWCFYYNPARAANISEVDLFYTPSIYGLQEIKSTGISYRDNSFGVDYSIAAHTFGYEIYRETVYSVNLSVPIYDFLFIGSNTNLNHLFIKEYGTGFAVSFDAGAKMFLSENFSMGFSATNLSSSTMTMSNDRLPQTLAAGIAYLSDALNLGVEYYKEIGFPSAVRLAAEYSPTGFFTVRTGTASGTNSFNAGLSLRLSSFGIEYGAMFHHVLGTTHSFGVSLRLGDRRESEFEISRQYRESLRKR